MIPPPAQRTMAKRAAPTVVEVDGSHAVYVSKPSAVAELTEQAAKSLDRGSQKTLRRAPSATRTGRETV